MRSASVRAAPDDAPPRRFLYLVLGLAAATVVALDQLTKQVALATLKDAPVDVIEGVLTFRLTYNPGGAFGILRGVPGFFLIATVVVIGIVIVWARHLENARWAVALGLVLGGGLGNLVDRVFRDTGGRVVDFIDLHVWPVFNLADSAIVTGVGLILWLNLRHGPEDPDDRVHA